MDKFPYVKYIFSLWIAAIITALIAKYLMSNVFALFVISAAVFWLSVKAFSLAKAYR